MFNRRMFVALAVCLAVSASSAFAGGNNNGGTKKNSHIKVRNDSENSLYVFIDVDADDIEQASFSDDPLGEFEDLGGKLVESGGEVDCSVKAGSHRVTIVDVDQGAPVFVDRRVSVNKGQTKKLTVRDSDLPVIDDTN